jgi:hypothetical protein
MILGRTKTRPRRQACPDTGLVTSSATTIPRIVSHGHRVVLVLCSASIVLLFLTSPVWALWCAPSHPHLYTIVHPMALILPPQSPLFYLYKAADRPALLLEKKGVTGAKKFPTAWNNVCHSLCSPHIPSDEQRMEGPLRARCAVDKQTQICNACISALCRSVGVDLTTCVLHPCHQ